MRKQHPDRLRRAILDPLERVVSDPRRAAQVKWRSEFHAVWGGGHPRVYDSVRLISGRYYPKSDIASGRVADGTSRSRSAAEIADDLEAIEEGAE